MTDSTLPTMKKFEKAPARFGIPRKCLNDKAEWSGDCFRYDIFEFKEKSVYKGLAMRWVNGSGCGWLIAPKRDNNTTNVLGVVSGFVETARWDFCHFLYETAHKSLYAGCEITKKKYERAFLEGRMKKKTRKGVVGMIIEQSWIIESNDGRFWDGTKWGVLANATIYPNDAMYDKLFPDPENTYRWVSSDHKFSLRT